MVLSRTCSPRCPLSMERAGAPVMNSYSYQSTKLRKACGRRLKPMCPACRAITKFSNLLVRLLASPLAHSARSQRRSHLHFLGQSSPVAVLAQQLQPLCLVPAHFTPHALSTGSPILLMQLESCGLVLTGNGFIKSCDTIQKSLHVSQAVPLLQGWGMEFVEFICISAVAC